MWDGGVYKGFICPLCKSEGYVRVRVQKTDGFWYQTEFYKCFGCSVMFHDPADFALQKQHVKGYSPFKKD